MSAPCASGVVPGLVQRVRGLALVVCALLCHPAVLCRACAPPCPTLGLRLGVRLAVHSLRVILDPARGLGH